MVDKYSNKYDKFFRYYSNRYFGPFVDWRWFKAQAIVESQLDSTAKSGKGATGLMQLLPSTFREVRHGQLYAGDILDPQINISAGMLYNRKLYRKWNGIFNGPDRFFLMLASYNAGFYHVYGVYRTNNQVRQWDDIKGGLPGETRRYLQRITKLMQPVQQTEKLIMAGTRTGEKQLHFSSIDQKIQGY